MVQTSPSLRSRLAAELADMPPAQQRLSAFLLENLELSSDLTITELADRAGVSIGTISHLCRRFGLRGYQELRLTLARAAVLAMSGRPGDLADVDGASLGPGESDLNPVQRVFGASVEALLHTARQIEAADLDAVVARLAASRQIECVGVGTAGIVAQEAALKLRKLGLNVVAHQDTHAQAMSASVLGELDTVLAISPSGRTRDTIWPVQEARKGGAFVIATTSSARSPLGLLANIVLPTVAYDTSFHTQPMASAIVEIAVVHTLFLSLLERGGDATSDYLGRTARAVEIQDVRMHGRAAVSVDGRGQHSAADTDGESLHPGTTVSG